MTVDTWADWADSTVKSLGIENRDLKARVDRLARELLVATHRAETAEGEQRATAYLLREAEHERNVAEARAAYWHAEALLEGMRSEGCVLDCPASRLQTQARDEALARLDKFGEVPWP